MSVILDVQPKGDAMDWPVTFKTTNGLRFRVDHVRQPPPPRKIGEAGVARPAQPREPASDALAVHVEGRGGWHVMGTYAGEEDPAVVIEQTLRWWADQTGDPVFIRADSPPRGA